jgi:CheY-like chemotaxis protein
MKKNHLEDLYCLNSLMSYKVRKVLLVASLYDYFLLEEDGRLTDLLGSAYKQRDLGYVPTLHRIKGGQDALKKLSEEQFDMVVTTMRIGDMDPFTFGRKVKEIDKEMPVVILAYHTPELARLLEIYDEKAIDRIFIWHGDGEILTGIIQYVEDMKNAEKDTSLIGVQNILIIEDSISFYSRYLHIIFEELWDQTDLLLQDSLTWTEKSLRQRARPRVHLAVSYEEALRIYEKFKGNLMAVISEFSFMREGKMDSNAGLDFVTMMRKEFPSLPILLQSNNQENEEISKRLKTNFLFKKSHTLISDFRNFLENSTGFGDLIFRDYEGKEIGRIKNITSLYSLIDTIPGEILTEYVIKGNLTRWLFARTEFELARAISSLTDLENKKPEKIRELIINIFIEYRKKSHRGSIVSYSRHFHNDYYNFSRIGSGSIGGKARGLAFIDKILSSYLKEEEFPQVSISIPATLVLGTDLFDSFISKNNLLNFALEETSDIMIANEFLNSELPATVVGDIREFISNVKFPLAVRSSSLLEDALYQPFAGVYITKMLPNNQLNIDERFRSLASAIKLVYASTFFRNAKSYIETTPNRVEDEKMAVIIQQVVGKSHGNAFYPHFSGVARSYNYYPVGNAKPEDGVANLAAGLGKTIVDGGVSLRYTPAYPGILPQFGNIKDMFAHSQKEFYGIDLSHMPSTAFTEEDQYLVKLGMDRAEKDGILKYLASTYSGDNDRVYDGLFGQGPRIVTFAHILKNEIFPLSKILEYLLKLSEDSMGCPVEIEFAVTLDPDKGLPAHFGFLQVRPLVVSDELVKVEVSDIKEGSSLCHSKFALGNGIIKNIYDIVYVKKETFNASQSSLIAKEVDRMNNMLRTEKRPYLLIGPGRWGSTDPWLGIPVNWSQISGVKVIVEASLDNMNVDPSQGSHFFQNMTSLRIGYFTVPLNNPDCKLDWAWLDRQTAAKETQHLRHIRLEKPLEVQIDGRLGQGVIFKTGEGV